MKRVKQIKWSILLFILLAIALSGGVSYIGLTQTKQTNADQEVKEVHKMTIALVNEDQGMEYQKDKVVFGDQFVKKY